jgi:hypothetical protein
MQPLQTTMANTLYESLGGQRSEAVMWDYRYADS